MNAMVRTALCLFLLLAPLEAVLPATDEPIGEHNKYQVADLVFRNGAVYTVDAARSWASAVAVAGNRIVYVGTEDGAAPFVGAATRVVDLRGRMMLPGFQDSHVHPSTGGIAMTRIQLNGVFDRGEVFALLGEYADAHSGLEWIVGSGWEADAFKILAKDGIVVREEQLAQYPQIADDIPDTNPRGCQKPDCLKRV